MPPSSRWSRRKFMALSSSTAAGLLVSGYAGTVQGAELTTAQQAPPRTPDEILRKLIEGNQRFAKGEATARGRKPDDFSKLAEGQAPLAIIVGCADSRVSPELLFDQGIGDLFVVRVAGNVISGAGASIKGSIEYGIAELGATLVMVLGHTNCGAVKSAMKHIDAQDVLPGAINELVNTVKPAVLKVKNLQGDLLKNAIKANVEIGVERLRTLDPILAPLVKDGKVKVVGGVYDLLTGKVEVIG